ncbi:hypothetical protein VKS41_003516 [Umbelopsis sp. WA50703]
MSLVGFISEKLATVELKDEEISEYIAGIVSEEFLEESEKREALTEFLSESTNKPTDDLIDCFLSQWHKEQEKEKEAAELAKAEAAAKAKEREKNSLAAGIPNSSGDDGKEPLTMSRRMAPKQMTKEERARRERLMREYGYDLEDVVEGANGETEIVYKDRSKKATAEDPLLMSNRNSDIIKEQEKNRRDQMKQQSEIEKERIKQQQEKQKLDKEKEKRRTMKKEKRRM